MGHFAVQTVEELVSHVAEKWAGTGSRLGSDVTILSPQTVGVGQLQFQVKKENVLVGGNLVRRIYFYSFIAQEDDMEAHATAAVMGYLYVPHVAAPQPPHSDTSTWSLVCLLVPGTCWSR